MNELWLSIWSPIANGWNAFWGSIDQSLCSAWPFYAKYGKLLLSGTGDTLWMTIRATLVSFVFGILLAVLLYLVSPKGLKPINWLYRILDIIVNILRSVPFIILMVLVIPVTRFLAGKAYGSDAAVVPLVIAAVPYVARMFEGSLMEVNPGVIEAAQSMGCSTGGILFRVVIPESRTSLIVNATICFGTILGYSAMSGAVGGGGLGQIAIQYGYQRYKTDILFASVILLVLMMQAFQLFGMWLSRKLDNRLRE